MKKILFLLLLTSLSICMLNGCTDDKDSNSDKTANESEITVEPDHAPEIAFACAYYDKNTYVDDCDNTYEYEYNVPEIVGVHTEYINSINSELATIVNDDIAEEKKAMEEGYSPSIQEISFDIGNGAKGCSLIVKKVYIAGDYVTYNAYTFDDYGNEVTNKDILDAEGILEDQFLEDVWEIVNTRVYANFINEDGEYMEGLEECMNMTKENISMDTVTLFYSEKLCILVDVDVPAGAGTYTYLFEYK